MDEQAVAKRFALNLRMHRAGTRMSQEVLALRADVHRTQISLMESGQRLPRLDTIIKLAGGLGIGVDALIEGIAYTPNIVEPGGFKVVDQGQGPSDLG